MGQPPPTVKDTIKARIDRLRERKRRSIEEAASYQAQIDALKVEMDALTPADEDKLTRLQVLSVIKAED